MKNSIKWLEKIYGKNPVFAMCIAAAILGGLLGAAFAVISAIIYILVNW